MRLRSALFPKRTSAQRLDQAPKLDGRLRSGTVPVIAIPIAFRRTAARAVHSAHLPTSHSRRTTGLHSPFRSGFASRGVVSITVSVFQTPMPCAHPTVKFRIVAILDGVTPALKAARTAFNFPCVKGTAATASTPSLRETAASCFPRRFCSAMTADSNWSSSWSLSCLTAFGKSAGRTWREGIALGGTGDSEDREGASPMGADENRSGDDERARVPIR
jgi:hypothetical protein